jgi:DNA-binding IclR family transcriptional regulator
LASIDKEGGTDVLVLVKAIKILEVLATEKNISLSQATQMTKVSKPAAFRILSTLTRHGYAERVEGTRKYQPGPQLIRLSLLFSARIDIVSIARPYLRKLHAKYGETVNLGVLRGTKILYVDIIEGSHGLRMSAEIGSLDNLHSTALGLAVLSGMSKDQARSLITQSGHVRLTPKTLTNVGDLMAELQRTQKRGYGVDDEYNEHGARCVAAAFKLNDQGSFAAISLSGPTSRINQSKIEEIGRDLKRFASEIQATLGLPARLPSGVQA